MSKPLLLKYSTDSEPTKPQEPVIKTMLINNINLFSKKFKKYIYQAYILLFQPQYPIKSNGKFFSLSNKLI